jgi:hypothetical protein
MTVVIVSLRYLLGVSIAVKYLSITECREIVCMVTSRSRVRFTEAEGFFRFGLFGEDSLLNSWM